MTTRTNYMSLMALDEVYKPAKEGFVSKAEAELIKKELELEQRTEIELNDIRDMTVLFFSVKSDAEREKNNVDGWREIRDKTSAIVCVIDTEKMNRGCEI